MTLDFEEIKNTAKKVIAERQKNVTNIPITDLDKSNIDFYVNDLEEHIRNYADDGEQKITYDCSKLKRHIFFAFANEFKLRNPLFFVVTSSGDQRLIVEWTGKSEV